MPVANGLREPSTFEFAPDGRIFVAQQTGQLRVIKDGQLLPTPFVSLPVERDGERGVDGIVFDPDFENNGFVYIYYTRHDEVTGASFDRLSRFTASAQDPDVADPASELVLLDGIPTHSPGYHNGGVLQFAGIAPK